MKENLFKKNKIRTYTGRYIDVFDLKPDGILKLLLYILEK